VILILIHLLCFFCLKNSSGDVVDVQVKIKIHIVQLLQMIYKRKIIFLRNCMVMRVLPHEPTRLVDIQDLLKVKKTADFLRLHYHRLSNSINGKI